MTVGGMSRTAPRLALSQVYAIEALLEFCDIDQTKTVRPTTGDVIALEGCRSVFKIG
jgi:hypothetical protein